MLFFLNTPFLERFHEVLWLENTVHTLIIPNTCPWHIYHSWTPDLQQFIWHFHWDVTGQHKAHCSIMLEDSSANLPNSSWWNHIHPFVHAKNLSQSSFPSFTSRVQSLQCTWHSCLQNYHDVHVCFLFPMV